MRRRATPGARPATRASRVLERVRRRRWVALGVLGLTAALTLQGGPETPGDAALTSPGTGRLVWVNAGSSTPQHATWDGTSWATLGDTAASIGEWRIVQGAESPTRDEAIVVGVDAGGGIAAMQWGGSSWTQSSLGSLGSATESFWWGFDVAYESQSGDALMVWNTSATDSFSYSVWDGSAWAAPATATLPVPGEPQQMQLAASPLSDEMVLVVSNASSDDYALVWNGSSWGNPVTLSTGTADDRTDIDVAYESLSGDAIVAFGDGSSALTWRSWDGTAWSSASTLVAPPSAVGNVRWVDLASDRGSDRLAVGVVTFSSNGWVAVWNGTGWQDATAVTNNTGGSIWPAVAVAFESSSGEALAVYTEPANAVRYRTWAPGGPWSAEQVGPDPANDPNSLVVASNPSSDEIMLAIQDADSDLELAEWSGSAWSTATQVSVDTGQVKNQPFVFLWDLEEVDLPPVFAQDLGDRTDSENTAISLSAAATDPEGATVTYGATGLPAGLTIDSATGLISGTIDYTAAAGSPHAVSITASDQTGNVATDTFTWTVSNVNRSPAVDHPGHQTFTEGDTVSFTVTATDPDGDPFTWSATNLPPGITIDSASGLVSGTVAAGAAAGSVYSSTISATDTGSPPESGAALVNWTIGAQLPPSFDQDLGDRSDAEGDVVSLAAGATDPNGDTLVYSASGLPPGVLIDSATGSIGGTIPYTAAAGSPYAVTVTVTDPGGLTDTDTFTWTVINTNRAPVALDDSASVAEDTPGGVTFDAFANDSDPDAQPLVLVSYNASTIVSGTLTSDGVGGFTYVPGPDFWGTESFTYVVGDGSLNDAATVTIVVTPVADPPEAVNDAFATGEGVKLTVPAPGLLANDHDEDGDPVSALLESQPPNGSVTITADGSFEYTPDAGFRGTDIFTYRATDGSFVSPTATVFITVDSGIGTELWYLASNGTTSQPRLPFRFTAPTATSLPNYDSDRNIDPGLTIRQGGSETTTDATKYQEWSHVVAQDLQLDGPASIVLYSAINNFQTKTGHPYVWLKECAGDGTGCTTFAFGELHQDPWTPTGGFEINTVDLGSHTRTIVAGRMLVLRVAQKHEDNWHAFDTADQPARLEITVANQAPVAVDDSATTDEDVAVTVDVTANDADRNLDPATVSVTVAPATVGSTAVVDGIGGVVFTPAPDWNGTDTFTYQVCDTGALCDTAVVTVTVASKPDAPVVATPDGQASAEGDAVSLAVVGSDPDGDALSWSASGLPDGLSIDPVTGVISGSVGFDAAVSSPFTVSVTATDDSPSALSSSVLFAWVVGNTNRSPAVTSPGSQSHAEGDVVTFAVPGSDPDGDGLTWSAAGLPGGLSIDPVTGVIAGTVSFDASPGSPYAVTVTVTDDGAPNLSDSVSFSWDVANTNRAPVVADPGAQASAEGDTVSLFVAASDPDANGLSWSATGLPDGLSIDPVTGEIAGFVLYSAAGSSPFAVTVTVTDDDVASLSSSVSFAWSVGNTNRAPVVADPGAQASAESDAVSVAIAAVDPDGNGLSYAASGLPGGLSIDPVTGVISGTVSYDASPGSPYAVTVTVTDDGSPNLSSSVSFAWSVGNTNRAPVVADPGAQASAENDVVSLAVGAVDPDGNGLSFAAAGLPGGLSIDPVTGVIAGTVSYDASPGSPYAVTVTVTDDGSPSLSSSVSLSWSVGNTNRAPVVADPGAQASAENDVVSLVVGASDPDGNGLSFAAAGLPDGLSIDPVTGVIAGTVSYDASPGSPYAVTVTVTDDDPVPLASSVSFSWDVANTNRAPVVADPGTQTNDEGDTVSLSLAATDPDGNVVTWSATGLPDGLTLDAATGLVSGSLTYVSAGSTTVVITATDDGSPALSTSRAIAWSVSDVNRRPVVTPPMNRTSAEGDVVSFAVAGVDADGDVLAWFADGLPGGLSIDTTTGRISGTIDFEAAGSWSVTVTAFDDGTPVLSDGVTFTWSVTNTNRAPIVVAPTDPAIPEGSSVDMAIEAADPDGDALTWAASGLPPGLMLDPATGRVTGILDFTTAGTYSVSITVTDDGDPALTEVVEFVWTTADTNRAPLLGVPADVAYDEGTDIAILVDAEDPDGDGLRFMASGLPPGIAIDRLTGQISGTSGFSTAGVYTIEVTVTDDGAPSLATSGSFVLRIGNVNQPPQVVKVDDRSDRESTAVDIALGATDPDGDALRWSAAGLPAGVAIDAESGILSGRLLQAGTYTVTITASDGVDATSSTFVWSVTVPGAPVFDAVASQTATDGDTIALEISASHPVEYEMTFTAEGLPPGLTVDAVTGRVSGTLTQTGEYDVVITATDERDRKGVVSFRWTVAPNDPPVAGVDRVSVQRDTLAGPVTAVIDILGNDQDPEGLEVFLRSVDAPEFGAAEVIDGSVVYRSPDGFTGTVVFGYTIADPAGNETVGEIEIVVHEPLEQRFAVAALEWRPADDSGRSVEVVSLDTSAGTELVMGTVVQSLHVLRVPLGLLGGAVLWSLLLGGAVNIGFLSRYIPALRRRRHGKAYVAIVMVPQGGRVPAQEHPGTGAVVHRFLATDRRIEATGRVHHDPEGDWVEVLTPNGAAWVPAGHVTEHVDRSGFNDDPMPIEVLNGFIAALRVRGDLRPYVSPLGLTVAHHGPLVHYTHDRLGTLLEEDREVRVWKGRNPAFQDFEGTFDFAVATGVLDAWDHPKRELLVDGASVPSTVIPVEFTNFHAISIGADLQGRERLDQSAWLVFFDYVAGEPTIIALCREG